MMTVSELLDELQALGVVLGSDGGRLSIDAPKGVVTPAIRAELARHKAALLPLLAGGALDGAQLAAPTSTPTPEAEAAPAAPLAQAEQPESGKSGTPPDLPTWAAELPVKLDDWPAFVDRHGLGGRVRLTWPEGAPGLVVEVVR